MGALVEVLERATFFQKSTDGSNPGFDGTVTSFGCNFDFFDQSQVLTADGTGVETILKLGRQFNAVEIFDDESGVNHAVHLADQYILDNKYDRSVIFPQDIPIMRSSDIDNLLGFRESENSVIIVPSRQLNGTNALVRCSTNIMKTQYDRGSYVFQLDAAKATSQNVSVALIRRIMLDIDDEHDLTFMLNQNEKPDFCKRISNI